MRKVILIIALTVCMLTTVVAEDSFQWRGPERTGVYNENNLLKEWPEQGLQELWSISNIGTGFSSVAVSEGMVYVTGRKNGTEMVTAIDSDGNKIWQQSYGRAWNQSYPDSRCTPTIENGKIYVGSGLGDIVCLNTSDGNKIWQVDGVETFEGRCSEDWGYAESLLLVDEKVIFTPGGNVTTMVALDKENGETVWQTVSIGDRAAFVSPIMVIVDGKKIIINVLANHIIGVDADKGKILWTDDYAGTSNETSIAFWDGGPYTNTNTPIYHDHHIYVTSGYDHVGAMFQLSPDGMEIRLKWIDPTLDVHHGGVVLVDGHIYGSNWVNNRKGNWCCIDWDTGKTLYEKEWNGYKGSIVAADGMLYCYDEMRGNIGLVKATPDDFEVISTFRITKGDGPYWAHPVISNGILYIRHGDVLMAFSVKQ